MFLKEILILFHYGWAVKCSIIPKSSSLFIKKQKNKNLEVNNGIYPIQYMAPTNLQVKQTASKNSANCITKKKKSKKNNKTKPALITLAFPLGRFNKTRVNPKTVTGYLPHTILSPFPLAITTNTRHLQYVMIQST